MFKRNLTLFVIFVLSVTAWAENLQTVMDYYKPDMRLGFIFISKVDMQLTLVDSQGQVTATYPIACGRNIGQKQTKGDNRTPEGYFLLQKVHDSQKWGHNFHDGKGYIKHAYGPYFMRLQTGFQGIGIHGTHAPESIGTRATEGCIRLENSNVLALEEKVKIGMPVIIGPEAGVQSLIASKEASPKHPLFKSYGNATVVPEAEESLAMEYIIVDTAPDAVTNEPATTDTQLLAENTVAKAENQATVHVEEVKPAAPAEVAKVEKKEVPVYKAEKPVAKDNTPVVSREEALAIIAKEQATAVAKTDAPIVKEEKPVAPVVVKEETPVVVKEEPVAPVVVKEETPVVVKEEPVAPVVVKEEKPVAPVVVKEEAPVVVKEEPVAPAVVKEEPVAPVETQTAPVEVKEEPAEEVKAEEEVPVALPDPVILVRPSSTNAAQLTAIYRGTAGNGQIVVEEVRGTNGQVRYEVRYKVAQ